MDNKFISHPKAKYWHPTKNGNLTPDKITKGSAKKCWFICEECNHDFVSDPNRITSMNIWCPYCSSKLLCEENDCKICYEKSFKSYLDQENCNFLWEEKKYNPRLLFKGSSKDYSVKCKKCLHVYNTRLSNVAVLERGCPFCSHKNLCDSDDCMSCNKNSFASHPKSSYWDNEKNDIKPRDVFKNSSKKFWFSCESGHSFDASLAHVSSEKEPRWCTYCNGTNKKALDCFERSFADHPLSVYWNIEKNNGIMPRDVFKGNNKTKYWFNCDCGHSFETVVSNLSERDGRPSSWCPYCCVPPKKMCENNQDGHCQLCFEKSFASHFKSSCFDENLNGIVVSNVFKGDNNNYWFNCEICSHKFYQSMNVITQGAWCHYCSGHKLCDDNECKECFEKSFASHEKVKSLDQTKNQLDPRSLHKNSSRKLWFICENEHLFETIVSNLSGRNGRPGSWCPYCINKTEQKLYDKMKNTYPMLEQQYKVDWCKSKSYLPFDFVLKNLNIIIELDGPQHFRKINDKWRSPEEEQKNDKYKMKCANDNGFSVIRILQEDVYYDTYDWDTELDINIKKIMEEKQIVNIFICKNNEYNIFQ